MKEELVTYQRKRTKTVHNIAVSGFMGCPGSPRKQKKNLFCPSSTKHHNRKAFDFSAPQPITTFDPVTYKLQLERKKMMQNLQNLKQGAVSAIQEKEQQILQLKEKIEAKNHETQSYNQLSHLRQSFDMKTYELEVIQRELGVTRNKLMEQLQEKDREALFLGEQLEKTTSEFNKFNQDNQGQEERLNSLLESNEEIKGELATIKEQNFKLEQILISSINQTNQVCSQIDPKQSLKNCAKSNNNENILVYTKTRIQELETSLAMMKQRNSQQMKRMQLQYENQLEEIQLKFNIRKNTKNIEETVIPQILRDPYPSENTLPQGEKAPSIKYNLKRDLILYCEFNQETRSNKESISASSRRIIQQQFGENESQFSAKYFHYEPTTLFQIRQKDEILEKERRQLELSLSIQDRSDTAKSVKNIESNKFNYRKQATLIFLGSILGVSITYLLSKIIKFK